MKKTRPGKPKSLQSKKPKLETEYRTDIGSVVGRVHTKKPDKFLVLVKHKSPIVTSFEKNRASVVVIGCKDDPANKSWCDGSTFCLELILKDEETLKYFHSRFQIGSIYIIKIGATRAKAGSMSLKSDFAIQLKFPRDDIESVGNGLRSIFQERVVLSRDLGNEMKNQRLNFVGKVTFPEPFVCHVNFRPKDTTTDINVFICNTLALSFLQDNKRNIDNVGLWNVTASKDGVDEQANLILDNLASLVPDPFWWI